MKMYKVVVRTESISHCRYYIVKKRIKFLWIFKFWINICWLGTNYPLVFDTREQAERYIKEVLWQENS